MAKRSSRTSRSTKPRKRKPAMIVEEETTRVIPVEEAKRRIVSTETTDITTEPKVEIRQPATLAQALTEPAVAVVKPETRVRKTRKIRRIS